MKRVRGDLVDGVLLLDKPAGTTSNGALQAARRLLDARKAGHTGTLDPLATGLLPVAFGEAAKFAFGLLDADKTYQALLQLGVTTTTGDAAGEVLERCPVAVTSERLDAVLAQFVGTIEQVPPMHSALKHAGRPLYEYARAGISIERAPRRVTIRRLRRGAVAGDRVEVEVECSKGTYVRTLAQDIGARLGCGAHLAGLRRTRIGAPGAAAGLSLERAVTLDDLARMAPAARRAQLLAPDVLLRALPRIELDAAHSGRLRHGQRLALGLPAAARSRIYDERGRLLGVAAVDAAGVLVPLRLMMDDLESESESEMSR